MKKIIHLIIFCIPLYCYAQNCNNTYKKWIDKDTHWLFNSYRTIGIADNDTLKVSKTFEVSLPKSIKWYNESPNKTIFILSKNQSISIETTCDQISEYNKDTIYTPTFNEIFEVLSRFHDTSSSNVFYKKIFRLAKKNKASVSKKNYIILKDGCRILLFNINGKDVKCILDLIQTFKLTNAE